MLASYAATAEARFHSGEVSPILPVMMMVVVLSESAKGEAEARIIVRLIVVRLRVITEIVVRLIVVAIGLVVVAMSARREPPMAPGRVPPFAITTVAHIGDRIVLV